MARLIATLALALDLVACQHTTPFPPGDYGSGQPFATGPVRRITFNLGDDRAPAWLTDGSGLLYSLQHLDRPDLDRCLGLLPPGGGRLEREVCDRNLAADDSTNVLTEPAADATGRLAYLLVGSRIRDIAPGYVAVVLGTLESPTAVRTLWIFPDTAADGVRHDEASQLRWLSPTSLVFLVEHVGYPGSPQDTVRTGGEIARLDLGGPAPTFAVVAGTRDASSVAAGETPDVIYFTLGGDSRVFRQVLSTGAVSVTHDFGAAGIARDVQLAGNRLVAVVGGKVGFAFDSTFGYHVQTDQGGELHVVDLATGMESLPAAGMFLLFRRPALAGPLARLVAEGYPYSIDSIYVGPDTMKRLVVDTVVARSADLWLVDLP